MNKRSIDAHSVTCHVCGELADERETVKLAEGEAHERCAFAERVNPRNFNFSPRMTAIVGAIIGHDYGVRDGVRGGRLTSISITSDGYVIAGSTASDGGGAFVGDASDLDRNIAAWKPFLSDEDRAEFEKVYKARVIDYRD